MLFQADSDRKNEFGKYTKEELAEMERRAEEKAKSLGIRRGGFMVCTNDAGDTWTERPFEVNTVPFTREDGVTVDLAGFCHGSSHGICLKHGAHKGRLVCPSRVAVAEYNTWDGIRKYCYNNAVYSDDHGLTWQASYPVQRGTGEGENPYESGISAAEFDLEWLIGWHKTIHSKRHIACF